MPKNDDLFSAAIEVLASLSQGSSHAELKQLLAQVEARSIGQARVEDFRTFQHWVESIGASLRDSLVSETGLNLLIDTTHDLSRTLNLQDLLRTIVTRARNLVGANVAWVTTLDDDGVFRTVNAEGHLSPAIATMKSRIDYGVVGLIMKSKSFFATQDYLSDTRFQHLPELDGIFRTENIMSLAGFPMLADGDVHGFLFVADRYSRMFSGRELSVLGSFALHAGLAMRNANAFRLLSEALDEAKRNRTALIEHIQRVEESAAAHDEMTTLLASGAGLQQFLQRMANQIDGAIFLYDDELKIREEYTSSAYRGRLAEDIKGGKIEPAALVAAGSQSRHTGRSVTVLDTGDEQCRAMTLHGGTGRAESLVICHQGELHAIEIRNLERSAVALSIAKLWNEKRETDRLIASSTLLRHLVLVTPPDPPTISAVRERLSLGADQMIAVALISISGLDRAAQTTIVRECAAGTNLLVDLFDDSYLAVGPEPALRAFLQKLTKSRDGWEAGGIISEPFADLASTAGHFARVNNASQILRKVRKIDRFLDQSEVNLIAKIFESGDASRLARYMEQLLQPIDKRVPRNSGQLKRTLLCYFDSQYSMTRVAEVMGLHINTVRQRLDTLREITGGWDDPVKALELHVALRLDAVIGNGEPR